MTQNNNHPLRFSVGFLLNQSAGYSCKFDFNEKNVQVAEDLDVSSLLGSLQLTRTAQGLVAEGYFDAQMPIECVRCLKNFGQQLRVNLSDLFVFPPEKASDPLLRIPETAILDLRGLLREYLLLEIPIRPVCTLDCKGLCPICGRNRNEVQCEHPDAEVDPRMEALRSLLSET